MIYLLLQVGSGSLQLYKTRVSCVRRASGGVSREDALHNTRKTGRQVSPEPGPVSVYMLSIP